jgi:hypothetical protein
MKKPSFRLIGRRVLYFDMFGEAEIIIMKHLQTRDYKDENVPASCTLLASHKIYLLHWTPFYTIDAFLNAFPHGIFGSYYLHGSVRR